MAEQRYEYVPAERWLWLGPALRGIDADLRDLEAGGGTGAGDPRLPQQWAFFGDSITNIGEGYPFYVQVLSAGRITAMYVESNPGQTSGYLLDVLDEQITTRDPKPGACLVLCGANDAQANVPVATFRANVENIVSRLKQAGIRPVLGTVTPNNTPAYDQLVRTYNAWLSRWAGRNGVPIVDFYTAVSGSDTGWRSDLHADGLHPNAKGCSTMGKAVVGDLGALLSSGKYVVQPQDGSPNLQVNSTFRSDSNGDGVPDGCWSSHSTISTVPDAAGMFSWARVTIDGQAATNVLHSDEILASSGKFEAGDVLRFSALVRSGQDTTESKAGLQISVVGYTDAYAVTLNAMMASWNGGLSQQVDGSVVREFTVPPGTTRIMWDLGGGPQDGTYDIALPTLVNLTSLGLL